jgi:hypothetical protein
MTQGSYEPGPPRRKPLLGYVLTAVLIALLIFALAWLLDPDRGSGTTVPGGTTTTDQTGPDEGTGTTVTAPPASTTMPETSTTGS